MSDYFGIIILLSWYFVPMIVGRISLIQYYKQVIKNKSGEEYPTEFAWMLLVPVFNIAIMSLGIIAYNFERFNGKTGFLYWLIGLKARDKIDAQQDDR